MKYLSLTAIALAATFVQAQTPDACIISCATTSCPNGLTDINCFCVTEKDTILACLEANCTAADVETATALGESVCGILPSHFSRSKLILVGPLTGGNNTAPAPAPSGNTSASAPSGSSAPSSTKGAPSGSAAGTSKPSGAATSASSSSNVMIGNGGLAGVLALAVAIAVAVGVVA